MRANELRQQITIQVRSNKEDSLGQELLSWTTFANIWAKIEQLSGRELMTANAERAENIAKITIRYRSDIFEKMRVLHGNLIYDITSVSDIEGRKIELELMVKTGLSDG